MTENGYTRLWKLRSRGCGIHLALAQVVNHADHTAASLDLALCRERRHHVIRLDIAVDGVDGSERLERLKLGERRDIARVQDEIYIGKQA